MLASLPMYDLPELAAATDAWWQGVAAALRREGLREVPDSLLRGCDPSALLLDPRLLMAQTCGYPLTHALAGRVAYLATPRYLAPGASGSDYSSLLLVRQEEEAAGLAGMRGCRLAVNAWDSQSGMNALRVMVAPLAAGRPFFREVIVSGSHRASLALLREGRADLAALDCVTYALLKEVAPEETSAARVLAASPSAPGLPYVTAGAAAPELVACLRAALQFAAADPQLSEVRASLLIAGFEVRPESDYNVIPAMAAAAVAAGYPELR